MDHDTGGIFCQKPMSRLLTLLFLLVVAPTGCTEIPRQTHTAEHVEVSRDVAPGDPGKVEWSPESAQLSDAVVRGDLEKVESLIAASPELVHSRVFGGTVLTGAISGALVRTRSSESIRAMVRLLLESGAEVDTKNAGGLAPLHYAARVGLKGVVEELLGKDADTNIRDSYGSTPLRDAALSGHRDVVEALLLKKADPDASNNIGMTPLHAAAEGVGILTMIDGVDLRKEMLDELQNRRKEFGFGGTPGQFLERIEKATQRLGVARNIEEFSQLLVEAMSGTGHKDVAQLLLEHGADVNARSNHGKTPLHVAAEFGSTGIAEVLLTARAAVNTRDDQGYTPLHSAAIRGHKDVTALFLANRSDVHARTNRQSLRSTPLHFAAKGHKDVVVLLLDSEADINARDIEGYTPLHNAVEAGHKVVAEVLLARKSDVNATNNEDKTPLHLVQAARHDVVEVLLAHGALVNAKDNIGFSPLHSVASAGYVAVVKVLLEHEATVNARTHHGYTPLHFAAMKFDRQRLAADGIAMGTEHRQVALLLLSHGADVDARARDGSTPTSTGVRTGHHEVVDVLLRHKAAARARRSNDKAEPLPRK